MRHQVQLGDDVDDGHEFYEFSRLPGAERGMEVGEGLRWPASKAGKGSLLFKIL